jgi:hypothetical protein
MDRRTDAGGGARDAGLATAADRWERLTDEDLAEVEGRRRILARKISERFDVSMREAKQQVHDLAEVARAVEGGVQSRGKQVRRSFERTGVDVKKVLEEGLGMLERVVTMSGMLGKSGTRPTKPPPEEEAPVGEPAGGTTRRSRAAAGEVEAS